MEWKRVIDELPIIPEGHHNVSVIVALFDACFDEINPGNGYGISHGIYSKEFFSKENNFLQLCPGMYKETDWVHFDDHVTHWMYNPEPPSYDPEVLNPIFKWYHENAVPQSPLKEI